MKNLLTIWKLLLCKVAESYFQNRYTIPEKSYIIHTFRALQPCVQIGLHCCSRPEFELMDYKNQSD